MTTRLTTALLGAALLLGVTPAIDAQDMLIYGGVVHTMAGAPITDGAVAVRDGKILAVGGRYELELPESFGELEVHIIDAPVVTPGLIDAHTTVGLTGWLNQDQDQDQLDKSSPIQPELRAVDAYNARDPLVAWLNSFGITTVHTGHAPGAVISGQSMIVKTAGNSVEEALVRDAAMVCATLGDESTVEGGKAPGTRSKAVALLREALIGAQSYVAKSAGDDEDKRPERDLRKEALARVLSGELPLLVTAQRHQDIATALRLAEEFGFRLVLDGAAEAHQMLPRIAAAGVPIIAHPSMVRAWGPTSPFSNATFELPKLLKKAGVPFAQQSGFEDYVPKVRVVLLEAAIAGRWGLPFEDNLASITSGAAKLLGIDDRVGTLEVGKDADLACYDGDPFEYTTHCVATVIDGEVTFSGVR